MGTKLKEYFPLSSLGCFYCGVDSTSLLVFLITIIGSLVLATTCIGISMLLRGRFRDPEAVKFDVFEAEERV